MQGVPSDGIIDTASNISIMGQELLAKVAAVARLRKDFHKSDKVPLTYTRKPFCLDRCIEMDISFENKALRTKKYINMDAHDQLLLSEAVCRQLGLVSYHPSVVRDGQSKKTVKESKESSDEVAPTIRVSLITSLRIPSNQGTIATFWCDGFNQHTLDLASGFWQIYLDEDLMEKRLLSLHRGFTSLVSYPLA